MNRDPIGALYQASAAELAGASEVPAVQEQPHPRMDHAHLIFPNLLDAIRSLLSIVVIALFVLTFVAQPFRIPSESMEPTLLVGDFLLVNKTVFGPPGPWRWLLPYRPIAHGDIVVFHFPLAPSEHVVKRVVGLPGDRVRLQKGSVYVNDQKQNEPFAIFEGTYPDNFRDQFPTSTYTDPGVDTRWWMQMQSDLRDGELVVPANSYFVLGDNRNHSRDSRYWGFVRPANIVGRPFIVYFSVREPSASDRTTLPDDKFGHKKNLLDQIVDFARWNRIFRLVR